MGEVDHRDVGRDRADHRVHDADELVAGAVVGEEGDGVEPRRHGAVDATGVGRRAYPASLKRAAR